MSKQANRKTQAPSSADEEQYKLLEEAKKGVNIQAFYMKRCLDGGKLMDALKHASNMICQLRTSSLSPKNYYALYIFTSEQLRHLEGYLFEEKQKGKRMSELYELVQYAGNILPRMYLLITVGSVYIKTGEAPAKEVLRDLIEMCRGVQHPTRGLFLRNYLSEMTKDKLPDLGSPDPEKHGTVEDSIDFILQNFTEMNKLWVRMQHSGLVKDLVKRESEREELKVLVGKNLARLSQLDGVDLARYSELVLPSVVEQIVNCKDTIAQQYLMECLIQVFPDEFHLRSLEVILSTCAQLQPNVDLKAIVVSLIDRLANYAQRTPNSASTEDGVSENGSGGILADIPIFNIFFQNISEVIEKRPKMPLEDQLSLQVSLVNLCLRCYPSQHQYVDKVLDSVSTLLESKAGAGKDDSNSSDFSVELNKPTCVKQLLKLLNMPLEYYKNILTTLELENYEKVMKYLSYSNRKRLAIDIVKNVMENATVVPEPEQVIKLLNRIQPLIRPEEEEEDANQDKEEFEEEQNLVASLVHLFRHEDPEKQFAIYVIVRKQFGAGGVKRIQHTLIPLIFRVLQLAQKLRAQHEAEDEAWLQTGSKLFKFLYETVNALAGTNTLPELCLRLFLQCAQAASLCDFERIAYQFLTQAFQLYENELTDSKQQFRAMSLIIASLQSMTCFTEENYDTLITKTAQYSSKLLKKADQCRSVYACSHLFWTSEEGYRDGKKVLECLQKSLKIANDAMENHVQLFVELLNQYLYYFEAKNEAILVKFIDGLLVLINTHLGSLDKSDPTINHYQNTLAYLKMKKATDPERYSDISHFN